MSKNMDPSMMRQAQQMMSNPAMANQAMAQMQNMSPEDLKNRMNQLPAAAGAAATPAAPTPTTVLAKLEASPFDLPEDLLQLVEEAEGAKTQGNTKFKAQVYALSKEEGGRHTPFFSNYRPQFYFRTTDVTGSVDLVGAEMCMPGDNVEIEVKLITPIAMDAHQRFAIREGGRTVGAGRVIEILE